MAVFGVSSTLNIFFRKSKGIEVPISSVLRFRKALLLLGNQYPFSFAFGDTSTRIACVDSVQDVYERLMLSTPNKDTLHFENIVLVALDEQGNVDEEIARQLIKLFRPDRKGEIITLLDFVKSIDGVYKAHHLLAVSIENSKELDRAFENIFNLFFQLRVLC